RGSASTLAVPFHGHVIALGFDHELPTRRRSCSRHPLRYFVLATAKGDHGIQLRGAAGQIKAREPIWCRECGHRIMYKKRTKRMVQFEAR
ncbi:unnamed protein product, partial [Mycena citricolor]